jgi:hypothetical protein
MYVVVSSSDTWSPELATSRERRTVPVARHVQSTDHELIPARIASLAAMPGSASGINVCYYPTWKHSPVKERNEQGCYNAIQTDRCLQLGCESLRLIIADQ